MRNTCRSAAPRNALPGADAMEAEGHAALDPLIVVCYGRCNDV